MDDGTRHRYNGSVTLTLMRMRTLLGIAVILVGLGFLLDQMNVAWADNLIGTWWPLLIIAVGTLSWRSNPRTWFGPLLIILVGIALLLETLDVMATSAWNYFWPVVIILVGGRMIMRKPWPGNQQETSTESSASVMFSGLDRKLTGPFTKGDASAWFGGVKLDFRDAQLQPNATLNVFAAFGGIDIVVPRSVRVVARVTPLFGGTEDKTQTDSNSSHTLVVTGTAMFGGVGIKNES